MASVDQGIANIFIRAESKITPASPQSDTANGGAPATSNGWYGWPIFGDRQPGLDYSSVSFFTSKQSLAGITAGSTTVIYYRMRGMDHNIGGKYDTWVVSGSPDYSGTHYTGSLSTPLRDIVIDSSW
jgi:hypothetical protein